MSKNGRKKKNQTASHSNIGITLKKFANKFMDDFLKKLNPVTASASKYPITHMKIKNNDNDIIYFEEAVEKLPTKIDVNDIEEDTYISIDFSNLNNGRKKMLDLYDISLTNDHEKFLITSDFELKHSVPVKPSIRSLKKQRKEKSLKTAGDEWFNMKPPEIDEDVSRDFDILQMRSVLDPKRFYKSNDRETLPKYFQIGKVMDNAADFYSTRVPKKQRKPTLADELLADAKFQKYRRKKMVELIAKRQAVAGKVIKKKRKSRN